MDEIGFSYDGKSYTVSTKAYDLNRIVLPDGRVLEPQGWRESDPPQPRDLFELNHTFKGQPVEEIARLMNGVIAEELKH